MRKLFTVGMVLATAALAVTAVFACGDKLMLLVGSARFGQIHLGAHPASILAYAPGNSPVPAVLRELERRPALKQAVHKFHTVENLADLDEALKTGKYDLLLVDRADADLAQQQAQSNPSRPVVLPMVYKSTKAEAIQLEKKFHCLLKAPGSSTQYLVAIAEAMELRSKAGYGNLSRQ